ncbi:MAG: hypothetical protein LC637_02035, partial [Xanthomonadaceae bacterium]|nr:hypothetical protein [Xanthomonadaceae bacterium]
MHQAVPDITALERAAKSGDPHAIIELGNYLLIEHPPGSNGSERGLDLLRQAAGGSHPAAAEWLLGGFYLQNLSRPEGIDQATHWLGRAARAAVAPAIDRLANLYLRGLGVPYSPQHALEQLARLAGAGFQRAAWEIGYLLSEIDDIRDPAAAVSAFARACALGYPPAYYSLGLRFASGCGVSTDPAFARALLLRAADAGFPDAQAAADHFTPASECGPKAAEWHRRLKDNHAAAGPIFSQLSDGGLTIEAQPLPAIGRLEAHLAGVGHPAMVMAEGGRLQVLAESAASTDDCSGCRAIRSAPSAWKWLSREPRVAVYPDFIGREERAQIMFAVGDALQEPQQYTSGTVNGSYENRFFSGTGKAFGALSSDAVVRVLERRIADSMGWTPEAMEPSSVICYQAGQEYKPHVDYFT